MADTEDPLDRLERLGLGARAGKATPREDYATTTLDLERLKQYAVRVSAETKLPTNVPPIVRVDVRQVKHTETYKTGFMGLQTKSRQVITPHESRTTIMVAGWLLFETHHWIEQYNTPRYRANDYAEANQWVLDRNGGLWKVWDWTDFEEFKSGGTNRSAERTARPMTVEDILALDHEYCHRTYPSPGRDNVRGNRDPGKIIRHAKGMGLSLALKNVLEGVQSLNPQRPGDRRR